MWTLKNKSVSRITKEDVGKGNLKPGHLLMLQLEVVFTDGTDDIAVSTFVKTRNEVRSTIKQNLDSLNEQEEVKTEIENDTFELEPTPEAKPEPDARQELQEAVSEAEFLKKAEELAVDNPDVQAKLTKLADEEAAKKAK